MVRYSILVWLFHPRLYAGLSRRLRSLGPGVLTSRDREGANFEWTLWRALKTTSTDGLLLHPFEDLRGDSVQAVGDAIRFDNHQRR